VLGLQTFDQTSKCRVCHREEVTGRRSVFDGTECPFANGVTHTGRVNDEGYWLDTGMQFNLGCLQLMARSEDKQALLGYQKR
jgi:hypothetical protein